MKIAASSIMREIDKYCIETLKIPGIVLMENAALKIIKNIDLKNCKSFSIICGSGNNGGDGFAVARHLFVLGKKVDVFLVGSEDNMSTDCKVNYTALKNLGVAINKVSNVEDLSELREAVLRCEITIDAIFGTGLKRNIEGIYDLVISVMNENSKFILSIDVPSGFNSDTGKVLGNCIKAHKTVTFQLYKRGFLNYGSDRYTGEVAVEAIGIPEFAVDKFHDNEFIVEKYMLKEKIKVRDKYSHKGDFGKILIAAGSRGFTGAAYIAAEAAVKSGAGLVTLACSRDIQDVLSSKLVEAMTVNYEDKDRLKDIITKCDCIAVGPGLGNNEDTFHLLQFILENAACPVVIDADGINVLKDKLFVLKNRKHKIIITPHPGEMSRITGFTAGDINENRIEIAKNFAKEHGIIVLLKGYNTVITDGEKVFINPTGNSSMASGGMGDCLTGIITSFIAQGYKELEAVYMAAFVHGYAGEMLSENLFCVSASSIIESLSEIIKELQR
ncbi:NAD(P)H-hydrate dehydratase [Clostridium sp. SYSU_GA19001]|uniref:NAD(P)H-hydrate dehydratase n=1 Tax=Clostridium caldaquaticum TaxID=2940653 RepID=UPI002076DCDD|nr:NAD(P)H-hydrate dehydratase [Clostridium caldaquaticum]